MASPYKTTRAAYELFHRGQLALAECENHGVRVDAARLDQTIKEQTAAVAEMEADLRTKPLYREWKNAIGREPKFGSRDELAHVLFNVLGHTATEFTTGGKTGRARARANKNALELIDDPFVTTYLKMETRKKAISTNLIGIKREMVEVPGEGWFLHPLFNLNTVATFRSSSNMPNWQNFPKRNPEVAAMVRPLFIPRRGRRFGEIDEGQIEVRVPACSRLTGDPMLIRYLNDPKSDMHRDSASEIYLIPGDMADYWGNKKRGKPVRQSVKSMFVFASFYGSAYFQCAKRLWDDIDRFNLTAPDGTGLKEWLKTKGITSLGVCDPDLIKKHGTQPGTFVHHMKGVETKLWTRFAKYKDWKNRMVDKYRREGGLQMVTGFAVNGQLSRNEITNYPIQGPAFHIVLQALVWITDWLLRYRMKTLPLGEIHDSIQLDVAESERDDVLSYARYAMTERIAKQWDWIDVPLVVESELSPVDGSWHECAEWVESNGAWSLKP